MANYDEKIYEDALKAAKADEKANLSEEEAEEVAKTFATAYAEVKNLKAAPTDDQKLELYGLSKQGLQNPPFEQRPTPGTFDFKRKYMDNAWKKIVDAGTTPAQAQKDYTKLVNDLIAEYGKQ